MAQYIATSTNKLLRRVENHFEVLGIMFPCLRDDTTGDTYDHPEDSMYAHVGFETDLELGRIIRVDVEVHVDDINRDARTLPITLTVDVFHRHLDLRHMGGSVTV